MNAQLKAVFEEPAHAWLSSLSALLICTVHEGDRAGEVNTNKLEVMKILP